jgi:hypothetical protein
VRCALVFVQPKTEIRSVEADVMSEAVVGYAPLSGLFEQPCVRDSEQPARGLGVEQREAAGLLRAVLGGVWLGSHECLSIRCSVFGWLV